MAHVTSAAAYDFCLAGHHSQALARVFRSLLLWPFPYDPREIPPGLRRPRILAGIVVHMARSALGLGRTVGGRVAPD